MNNHDDAAAADDDDEMLHSVPVGLESLQDICLS